jgi:hypothetical protein
MQWLFRTILLVTIGTLVGCASPHEQLLKAPNLTSEQRIALVKEEVYMPHLRHDAIDTENGTCVTLLECAIHFDDYEFAKWLLDTGKHPEYWTGAWGYKYNIIYAPLRQNFSDEKAAKYLQLMIDHGIDADVCDFKKVRPVTHAFRKGYLQSFKLLVAELENYSSSSTCVDDSKYIDDLYKRNLPYKKHGALFAKSLANTRADSPLAELITYYDTKEKHQAEMLFLMLEHSPKPDTAGTRGVYRCGKYSNGSALAFATCKEQEEVVRLLTSYYLQSDKFTVSQRESIFNYADRTIQKLPSEADLRERRRRKEAYEAELKAKLDAAFEDDSPAVTSFGNFQSVSDMLNSGSSGTVTTLLGSGNTDAISSAVQQSTSSMSDFDFHLYVDEIGVAPQQQEPEKTYFVGETCKRYPWASTCKNKPQPQRAKAPVNSHCANAEALQKPSKKGETRVCVE